MSRSKRVVAGAALTAAAVAGAFASAAVGSAKSPSTHRVRAQAAAVAPGTAPMAAQYRYLKVAGAPGDTIAAGYANQITVLEYAWGIDATSGKAGFIDLDVKFVADHSVPALETDAETGRLVSTVVLTDVDSSTGLPTRILTLTGVKVSKVDLTSNDPTDQAEVHFTPQQVADQTYWTDANNVRHVKRSCWSIVTETTC